MSTTQILLKKHGLEGWDIDDGDIRIGKVWMTGTRVSCPIPFFPDYSISFPDSYLGGNDISSVIIIGKNGRNISITDKCILKNPQSYKTGYLELFNKNVIGCMSQTLYARDIQAIYRYILSNPYGELESYSE
jgi:hypothetical protein